MPTESPLEKEYAFYQRSKAELLKQAKGKFALIKDEKLVGVFDTDSDAYNAGLLKFGNVPFLIVRITDEEERGTIPILEFGLLNADL